MSSLRDRFVALMRRLGATGDPSPLADAILTAWMEPARRYHGIAHLRDCLVQLEESSDSPTERDLVEAALWFHDAIYDPRAADNEERSADWARRALDGLGIPPAAGGEVARLVRLTRHDRPPDDPAGRLICDIDLSILGRSPPEFDEYDRLIQAEYAWVPVTAYREGRRRVLTGFLRRRPLYLTEQFRRRYETAAHANLERALTALDGPAA